MRAREIHRTASTIPDVEVRAALEKIVVSTGFQRSPQLQRFLRFVVDRALSGNGDHLKEYVIGTEVFGRPADYDPSIDSLVRVEAHRLRGTLDEYYRQDGSKDSVLIELTKGSYSPKFHRRPPVEITAAELLVPSSNRRRKWAWSGIIALLLLAAILFVLLGLFNLRKSSLQSASTIAILPFDSLSDDPANQFFCFGLMDEITTELAKTESFRVIARTSAQQFKRGDDIATIAQSLNANVVLEGSVQQSSGRVRVIAQLIRTSDKVHIWSETYERSNTDPLLVQSDIAHAIAQAVRSSLIGNAGISPQRTAFSADAAANQLYWKGVYFRTPMGKTGWRKDLAASADFLEQAIQKDPNFALAYSVLADVYVSLGWERGGGPITRDFMTRGRQAAVRALQLDNSLAEAYAALGTVQFFYDYDAATAEKSFQSALQRDPSNGKARMWYAYALVMQGRSDEAVAQAQLARELDPLSYVATTHLAVVHYFSRHNDETIRLVRETLKFADIAPGHGLLGMAYEVQQNYDGAIAEYQAGLRLVPTHSYIKGMLGHAYGRVGRAQDALKLLNDANLPFEKGGLSDLKVAYIYMGLGDHQNALLHLESDYQQRDTELPYINADPVFDPVRNHPRFVALLQKMGLSR